MKKKAFAYVSALAIRAAIALILSAPLYVLKVAAETSTADQWSTLTAGYAPTVAVRRNPGVKP